MPARASCEWDSPGKKPHNPDPRFAVNRRIGQFSPGPRLTRTAGVFKTVAFTLLVGVQRGRDARIHRSATPSISWG